MNFTQNSPAQIAQVLIGIAILFTFGLQFYVPMDILWRHIGPSIPKDKHNVSQILFRAGIILIMGGVAAAVPQLDPFIGLVGSVFFSILGKLLLNWSVAADKRLKHHTNHAIFVFDLFHRFDGTSYRWNRQPISGSVGPRQMDTNQECHTWHCCCHSISHRFIYLHRGNHPFLHSRTTGINLTAMNAAEISFAALPSSIRLSKNLYMLVFVSC